MSPVPRNEMRVGDADRERVADFLREHAVEGRLDDDELEERLGLTYRAVTVGDLEPLIVDLPHAGNQAPRDASSSPRPSSRQLGLAAIGGVLAAGGLWVVATVLAMLAIVAIVAVATGVTLWPLLLFAFIALRIARRRRGHGDWHGRRSGRDWRRDAELRRDEWHERRHEWQDRHRRPPGDGDGRWGFDHR